jgi:hypothetical protein
MKKLLFCALLLSVCGSAHAIMIECEIHTNENQIRKQEIDSNSLTPCSFIREGTICDVFVENDEKFWSYNFDPSILEWPQPGDEFIGVYLEGKLHLEKQEAETWETTSEEFMDCTMKSSAEDQRR